MYRDEEGYLVFKSHCGVCGRWVEGDSGDKVYPWNWRWTICPKCLDVEEKAMSEEELFEEWKHRADKRIQPILDNYQASFTEGEMVVETRNATIEALKEMMLGDPWAGKLEIGQSMHSKVPIDGEWTTWLLDKYASRIGSWEGIRGIDGEEVYVLVLGKEKKDEHSTECPDEE